MSDTNRASRILPIAVFLLFIAILAISLGVGVQAYSGIESAGDGANSHRIANTAIYNAVRAMDSIGAVDEESVEGMRALVLRESTDAGVFENRIYGWDGHVILEFAPSGDAYVPSRGEVLMDSDAFAFEIEDGTVTVRTDEGESTIAVRSGAEEVDRGHGR